MSDIGPVEGYHQWCIHSLQEADHCQVDVYVNRIRQLVRLAGLEGVGLTKLTFITGFPVAISIRLQQVPDIETLPMGDLIARAKC